MSESEEPPVITPEHAKAFGYIIHTFAKLEHNMQITVAGMLDTDLATTMLLMSDTHYRQKRQTTRNIHLTRGVNGEVNPDLSALLDDIQNFNTLRNHIAHSIWTAGQRPGSIKPMYIKTRSDFPKPVGHWHNEKDYTLSELQETANSLNDTVRRFDEFLRDTGLLQRVAANIEQINDPTHESPG